MSVTDSHVEKEEEERGGGERGGGRRQRDSIEEKLFGEACGYALRVVKRWG
jgi:hypothetical protein